MPVTTLDEQLGPLEHSPVRYDSIGGTTESVEESVARETRPAKFRQFDTSDSANEVSSEVHPEERL